MRLGFLLMPVLIFSFTTAKAQSAEDSVKNVIQLFFKGMYQADTHVVRHTLAPAAILQSLSANNKGGTTVGNESIDEFCLAISTLKPGEADEQIEFSAIQIDGHLASVWTPYRFYYKGRFSHCGVNSFQLVRLDNRWRIQYIIDTRRKAGCAPLVIK